MNGSERTINQVINKQSKSTNIDILKESNGDIVNKQDIASAMNAYFCTVGKDLASKTEAVPLPLVTRKYNLNPQNKHFNFNPIGVQDIRGAMVKPSKCFASDEISSYFLQLAIPLLRAR